MKQLNNETSKSVHQETTQASGETARQFDGSLKLSSFEKFNRGITCSIRQLPDFLIVGAQRGGTTSLYHYLLDSPCVGPASVKELHFFDKHYHKGVMWYRAHFPTLIEKYVRQKNSGYPFLSGEATASYLFHPQVPKRVKEVAPKSKLIIMLRNPIHRAYSQYCLQVDLGKESYSFEEALEREDERITIEREKLLADETYVSVDFSRYSYKARGRYIEQIPAWLSCFPADRILILKSEDFYTNTSTEMARVLTFLGLPDVAGQSKKSSFKVFNDKKQTYPPMKPATRERLAEYFAPYNAQLYQLLERDFDWNI